MTSTTTRRRDTDATRYYSVCTPSVFREVRVADADAPTTREQRALAQLQRLAEAHRASIESTTYRRG